VRWLRGDDVAQVPVEELVTWTRADGSRVNVPFYGTTDAHLRGVPIIQPRKRRVIATRRGKAARRRASSRVRTNRASIPFLTD